MKIKSKYRKTLDGYLEWIGSCGVFMRPKLIPFSADAPMAAEFMQRYESEGKTSSHCSEPEKLADYMQGKTLRDWHISEWRDGIRMGLFQPREFIGSLGCTEDNYKSILGIS